MRKILEVQDLRVSFPITGGVFGRRIGAVQAVDGVSFDLHEGETLGLVGESGCGKSTVCRAIINIVRTMSPGAHVSGKVIYHGESGPVDLLSLARKQLRPYRAAVQMIFQDPYSSLNPRMTVAQLVGEPLKVHTAESSIQRREKAIQLLQKVGLSPEQADRYPHEFSGGQRQRIGIARALATRPAIVIADEPVSALDVSIQAQIVNLLQDLQDEFKLSLIFIAHDLSVVWHISRRVAVMHRGRIVEIGDTEKICTNPTHSYTQALLSAVPRLPW